MAHPLHRSEREKEQKVRGCSKRSSFSQSVSIRDYYINDMYMPYKQPILELKTQPRCCLVSQSLSMTSVITL